MKKLLALFVFVGAIIAMNLPATVSADTAEWIDAATIKYGGRLYYDGDPSDGDRKAERDEGSGCWSTIKYESDRKTGSGDDINRRDEFGDCQKVHDNVSITFSNPEDGFVAGYRKAADTVIIYGNGDRGKQPPFNTFKSSSDGAANTYYLVKEDGTLEKAFSVTIGGDGRIAGGEYYLANNGNVVNDLPEGVQDTTTAGDIAGIEESCEDIGVSLAWIACGVLRFADNVISWADNQIASLLSLPSEYYDNPDLRTSWARIRNLSYLILLPIMLVMVLGTALGFQAIDAYTVKKALPRLVAAVLFIALSYDIGVFAIQVTETIGRGIMGLIGSPFSIQIQGETVNAIDVTLKHLFNPSNEEGGLVFVVILGGFIGALAIVSLGVLASYAFIFFLVFLTVFLLLAFRQILLILLLVLAPLAILSWIFPANNKLWGLWKGSFTKLLLLFPIVYLLVGAGRVFAVIVHKSGQQTSSDNGDLIGVILKLSAYILPYFFIPLVFKFAGSAFATIAGMAQDRERGLFDRQRKFRGQQMAKTWQKTQTGTRFKAGKEGSFRSKLNTGFQGASMIGRAGLRPSRWKENMGNAIRDSRWESGLEAAEKLPGAKAFFANDDGMLAALEGDGDFDKAANWLVNEKGYTQDQARLVAGQGLRLRNEMGAQAFALTALAKLPGTGTAYKGEKGIESWLRSVDKYTGGNKGLAASVVAAGKSGFRNGQQYEFSEAGFGDVMQALDMVSGRQLKTLDDGTQVRYGDGEVGEFIVDKSYKALGASGFVNVRNDDSAKALTRAAIRDLHGAVASGDKAVIGRSIAQLENIRDSSAQGKRTVTDAYIETLNENPITVAGTTMNAVDYARLAKEAADPTVMAAYRQVKHDYTAESAEAARQQQNIDPTQGPTAPGPGQGTLPGMPR